MKRVLFIPCMHTMYTFLCQTVTQDAAFERTFNGASCWLHDAGPANSQTAPRMADGEPRSHRARLCGASVLCLDQGFQLQKPHQKDMKKKNLFSSSPQPPLSGSSSSPKCTLRVRHIFFIIDYYCMTAVVVYNQKQPRIIYLLLRVQVDWKKSLRSFKELNVNFIFSKRIKTSFAQFCLLKINNNTYRLYMLTPNRNINRLSWKNKIGTMRRMIIIIQCVLSPPINKHYWFHLWMTIYAGLCKLQKQKFIYLQTATPPS